LTLVARGAKTTRPEHISKGNNMLKTLLSNPEDTPHTLRGISHYKKQKHIYKRFFNRFLCVFDCFSRYKLLEKYQL